MYAKEACQIIVKSLSNLYRGIKAPNILMNGGVNSEGLDSIQSWFRDPERVKQIESEVKDYEDRVQETARALDQKHRLEERINELNSKTSTKNSRK